MTTHAFPDGFTLRKANENDVMNIHDLLAVYAKDRLLLPRTPEDLRERIGNFSILELNGKFVGCTALRNYGNGLFEVRSLAVCKEMLGKGAGTAMVSALLENLRRERKEELPLRVFALTYRDNFFHQLGFRTVDKEMFPRKSGATVPFVRKRHAAMKLQCL
ncbi:MAG: GNAT family N-acetyltransferase [Lentisphaeria bacterium]|nr:GNAT family N-acetyltransferase [Lentisphaeria bacterium]